MPFVFTDYSWRTGGNGRRGKEKPAVASTTRNDGMVVQLVQSGRKSWQGPLLCSKTVI